MSRNQLGLPGWSGEGWLLSAPEKTDSPCLACESRSVTLCARWPARGAEHAALCQGLTVEGWGWQGWGLVTIPVVDPTICLLQEEGFPSTPDRLFKIVFVGNSSVGKTSFLGRFCDGRFSPGSAATVGEFST